jgi:cyclic-di-GMP-binding protein
MPSFDVVSQVVMHELTNAIDQTNREISNRFDFKGTNSRVDLDSGLLTITAPSEFQINQVNDILRTRISKRGIDVGCLEYGGIEEQGQIARQRITVRQGIDKELAKKIIKLVKDSKLKVQTAVQEDQVRISRKKRDDLQTVINLLKQQKLGLPLQYINFRD